MLQKSLQKNKNMVLADLIQMEIINAKHFTSVYLQRTFNFSFCNKTLSYISLPACCFIETFVLSSIPWARLPGGPHLPQNNEYFSVIRPAGTLQEGESLEGTLGSWLTLHKATVPKKASTGYPCSVSEWNTASEFSMLTINNWFGKYQTN